METVGRRSIDLGSEDLGFKAAQQRGRISYGWKFSQQPSLLFHNVGSRNSFDFVNYPAKMAEPTDLTRNLLDSTITKLDRSSADAIFIDNMLGGDDHAQLGDLDYVVGNPVERCL